MNKAKPLLKTLNEEQATKVAMCLNETIDYFIKKNERFNKRITQILDNYAISDEQALELIIKQLDNIYDNKPINPNPQTNGRG